MEHYHGDKVRSLFIAAAVIMAATLPLVARQVQESLAVSIVSIVIVSIAAGLSSPRYFWSAAFNVVVAVVALSAFEYYAVNTYLSSGMTFFFWVNQVLALLFIIALYYGVKTLRGMKRYQR